MVDLYVGVPVIEKPRKLEFSLTSVTDTRMFCVLAFADPSTARTVSAYVLFVPLSVGASKFGDVMNERAAVVSLTRTNENLA
jgi:hypothetical protein